jgi:hypothetical protein
MPLTFLVVIESIDDLFLVSVALTLRPCHTQDDVGGHDGVLAVSDAHFPVFYPRLASSFR